MKTLTIRSRVDRINAALVSLRRARRLLTEAEAPRATAKVRSAMKSAEGARRHAWGTASARRVAAAFDRHRAADPHCTCNDCMEYFAAQMEDKTV